MLEDPSRRLLVVLAAVNAGGKDGSIEELQEVLGAERIRIERIKRPIVAMPGHDLLRTAERLVPEPGEIVFFNRSYYEDPLHTARHDPLQIEEMCARIVRFEDELAVTGVTLVKLHLHIDKDEQLRRLDARQRHPQLHHLFNPYDHHDQGHWPELMLAFETVCGLTHTDRNPWFVIPGNDRSFRNAAIRVVLAHRIND
jgi:polyphosphate kinase 2 (PPK2 family)